MLYCMCLICFWFEIDRISVEVCFWFSENSIKANRNISVKFKESSGCPTTPMRPGHHQGSSKQYKKTVEHAINCLTSEMVSPKS